MTMGMGQEKSYTREDMQVFNCLKHPIWIFDMENKEMWWGNEAALKVWGAPSLDELLARDYKSDMTEATELRMKDRLKRMKLGETSRERWTFYPAGQAKTLEIVGSAITIEDGRSAILCEAEIPSGDFDASTTRGFGLFVHVSIAVCEFDLKGKPIYRNSEDLKMFGGTFLDRFTDNKAGEDLLRKAQNGEGGEAEVEQRLVDGTRWFAVSVKPARDPVTGDGVFIYSARDITEIILARQESTRAKLKAEFMSVIAHELRTPLHQVCGFADLLELTNLSEVQQESVRLIQRSTESLMAIINDLLDFSVLQEGNVQVSSLRFNLSRLLKGCVASMGKSRASSKGLHWNQQIIGLPDQVIGDPYKVTQVLQRLVENAFKFTMQGEVSFRATPSRIHNGGIWVRFEVQDTGIGIEEKHASLIFEKFQQINMANTRSFEGTGLGLALCKSLCDALGGKIGVKSALGRGSTFFVELPFALVTEKDCCHVPEQPLHLVSSGQPLTVLIVEDNKVNQKMAERMIRKMGHETLLAENGQIALDMLKEHEAVVDLVLMDIQMPVMDGLESTKRMRQCLSRQKLPIIGLTASFQSSDMTTYLDAGMNTCLDKPVRYESLKRTIETVVSRCARGLYTTDEDDTNEANTVSESTAATFPECNALPPVIAIR